MDRARFETLAEAYGGDVAAWPESVRDSAAVLMSAEPEVTRRILDRARALDAVLDAWRAAPASAPLLDRILAAAPTRRRRWAAWLSPAALATGLAAACVAGLAVGAQLSERTSVTEAVAAQATSSPIDLEPTLDLEGA